VTLVGDYSGEPVDETCALCGLPFSVEDVVARAMDLDGVEWCLHMQCYDAAGLVDPITLNPSDLARFKQATAKAAERAATFRKKVN